MVNTPVAPSPSVSVDLPEKRVQLYNISWQAYESILAAIGDRRSARLSYYRGTLEIMTPLEKHENSSDSIDHFIQVLTEEGDLNIKSMASTTLNRADLKVGAEPDKGYYIANEPLVRGKIVDLNADPPPDLIVEVDMTHTDINKNALYAEMGVPEFWRYNGQILTIYCLKGGVYEAVETSPTFPDVPKERLYQFLQDCAEVGETQAKRNLRNWIKEQIAI
ncbi:MAG: Uma2 family endonuclease [Timaviella obliquedivisa GSE-PSE-MK23-08B]|jgi:Uma2 family endonuclease|nr:Uma2 family endonuclease [Timaviella obliquedivisa GSE-PSE-MK23-08B]